MRKISLLLLALLLPLAACGDDDDPIGPSTTGSLSFTYSGDIGGSFSVSGEPRLDSRGLPQNEFAVATREAGEVFIAGFRPGQESTFDLFGIQLEGVTSPRTIQLCPVPTTGCPSAGLFLELSSTGTSFGRAYVLISGSITVSEINADRVRGSFQGTGILVDPVTGPDLTRTINISNGQFNVPVDNELGA